MNEKELLASIAALLEEHTRRIDERFTRMDERFTSVEQKLEGQKESIEKMDSRLSKLQINQENVVMPRLELLFEGHKGIISKLESTAQPDNIQDRVETLEAAVKYLSSEVNRLKKAE